VKRTLLFSLCLVVCAATASAGTITSISPAMVKVNSGEHFLTIYGSGLGNTIVFDGPAGHFELTANATFTGSVHFWVPLQIVGKSGFYNVYVRGGTGDSNVVQFEVRGMKFFPFVIIVSDFVQFQPISREGGYAKFDVITAGGEINDPAPRIDCFPASGSWFKMGNTPVNCTAVNSIGEKAEAQFTLSMIDTVGPVLKVPPEPIVVKATSIEGALVSYDVSAYDDVYGDAKPECLPRSGDNFPIGVTTVQCFASDWDGNVGSGAFLVEVLGDVKWYPLTVKGATVRVDARSAEGEYVDFKVEVTGTKDLDPTVTCLPKSGSLFPVGTTAVRCDAIDYNGMRGTGEIEVEVRDPNAPKFEKVYATPDLLRPDGRHYPIDVVASAYDDIDLRPFCSVFAVTSNQDIHLGDGDSEKEYDWRITGDLTLELRAETVRGDRYYDIWVACGDFYGNRVNTTTRVVVSSTALGTSAPPTSSKKRAGGKP
jgi:hypothetical protein